MLLTNHTLTGIVLGLTIDNPVVLAPTAVASHFLLDSIPHVGHEDHNFEENPGRLLAIIDCSVALCVAIASVLIWPWRFWHLVIGVVGATAPDLLYIPRYLIYKKPFWEPLFRFHGAIQTERLWLAPVEVVWASLMLFILYNLR